jgi:aminoglycoside/choline kinase family phosphotransferase
VTGAVAIDDRRAARAAAADAFLGRGAWGRAARAPLAGDASPRRYWRLTAADGARAVLMDADPADGEDVRPFAALTGTLRERGFSAPAVFDVDFDRGFLLLEDLGDALYARVCAADPAAEAGLYAAAVDLLAELHAAPPPAVAAGAGATHPVPPYDAAVLAREARLAVDWWAKGAGAPLSADAAAEFDALVAAACARPAADRRALVLRDYHAENLIWLPDRRGTARVGLLDYQDALAGSAAYDLISLLEDARRDTSADLRAAMAARYAAAARARDPAFDADAFAAEAAALAAQRNLKIVGIFARLRLRDGKPAYLDLIPRVWDHLMRDLSAPGLSALSAFVARRIPEPTAAALARVRAGEA